MLNQRDRHFAPDFHHARKQICIVHVKRAIEAHRKRNRFVRVVDFELREVRFWQRRGKLMLRQVLEIDAVEQQNVAELDAIDRTQTIKFKNAQLHLVINIGRHTYDLAFSLKLNVYN